MTSQSAEQCPECGMKPSFDGMWHKQGCSMPPAAQPVDQFTQQIVWTRLKAQLPSRKDRYRIRNDRGHESIGHYFPEEGDEDAGWVTMDFDGSIIYWAELNS